MLAPDCSITSDMYSSRADLFFPCAGVPPSGAINPPTFQVRSLIVVAGMFLKILAILDDISGIPWLSSSRPDVSTIPPKVPRAAGGAAEEVEVEVRARGEVDAEDLEADMVELERVV